MTPVEAGAARDAAYAGWLAFVEAKLALPNAGLSGDMLDQLRAARRSQRLTLVFGIRRAWREEYNARQVATVAQPVLTAWSLSEAVESRLMGLGDAAVRGEGSSEVVETAEVETAEVETAEVETCRCTWCGKTDLEVMVVQNPDNMYAYECPDCWTKPETEETSR